MNSARDVPKLAERCTYWLHGKQCPAPRADGSLRCWLHDAKRHPVNPVKP